MRRKVRNKMNIFFESKGNITNIIKKVIEVPITLITITLKLKELAI